MAAKTSWSKVKFGDVVRLSKARSSDPIADGYDRYVGLEHIEPEDLRIRRWGNVADGVTFTSVFKPGQVLFGKRRAYQRKVAVADFAGVCSGDIYVLESKDPKKLLPELLPFICQTEAFFQYAVGTSAGSLSPRTNWTSLADFEFALPPLEEQRIITELLGALESLRLNTFDAFEKAWELRLSMYSNLTYQRNFTDAPKTWVRSTIGESLRVCNTLRKPISSDVRSEMQGDYPYYGPTGLLDTINEFRLDGTFALIGEDGDHFLKYKIWSMTQSIRGKSNVNNHAHVLCGTEKCLTDWFFHFYRHRDIWEHLTKQGSGRLKLNKASLEKMPILIPPIQEQKEIIKKLENCCDTTDAISMRLKEVSLLSATIRNNIF